METEFELIAKTFQGLEEVLARELTALGAHNVQAGRRMVSFTGNTELMYRANLCLHTALRVLKPIAHFKAADADQVYAAVKALEWNKWLDVSTTFSVDSVVYSEDFRHSKFVAYKVKDAIADYFREREGKRPNVSITDPDLRLNMHIAGDDCTLSLDSSGESLHRRGYRVASVEAPMNEVLAAGLLLLAGWKGQSDFIDPMCGSGTLAIEAALLATGTPPGLFRKQFAFERWRDFDRELLDRVYNDDSSEHEFAHHIYASDIDPSALAAARANVKSARVGSIVSVEQKDFRQFTQPAASALMVINPPYGERIASPNLLGLYRAIGERLKHQFVGGEAWIISSREECFDQIGLKPSLKIALYNGSLPCEFRKYQIFDGKLGDFRAGDGRLQSDEERRRMADRRRTKPARDFKRRYDDEDEDEQKEIPAYMRRLHREFVERERREERYAERRHATARGDHRERSDRRNQAGGYADRPRGGYRRAEGDHHGRGAHRFDKKNNRYDKE